MRDFKELSHKIELRESEKIFIFLSRLLGVTAAMSRVNFRAVHSAVNIEALVFKLSVMTVSV